MEAWKKFGVGIRFLIMALCYFLAVRYHADVQEAGRIAVVSLADDGVTAKTAESICEEEQGDGQTSCLCFWREQKELRFSCRETGQSVQATGLLTEGDPELIARECGILAWQEKGCVMDSVTAQELFGTQQANGQLVWCGGEAYTVYGTFDSLKRTVVLRAEAGTIDGNSAGGHANLSEGLSDAYFNLPNGKFSGAGYDHFSLRVQQGASAKTSAEQLLMRCGLSGDIVDFVFPGVICGNLLLVLPVLLAAGLVRLLWAWLREGRRQRSGHVPSDGIKLNDAGADISGNRNDTGDYIVKIQNTKVGERIVPGKIVCAAMLAVTVAALFFTFRNYAQIPADMIPTRWSDFSFWPQWWAGQKANLLQMLGGAQGEMQLEALWSCGLSITCNFLSIAAGVSLRHSAERFG